MPDCNSVIPHFQGHDYNKHFLQIECTAENDLFKCSNGPCINIELNCNGADNCGDNSDEQDCGKKYPFYMFF